MHAKTWFPSNEMHESPNLTNEPLCLVRDKNHFIFFTPTILMYAKTWFTSNEMHKSPNLTNEPLCSTN